MTKILDCEFAINDTWTVVSGSAAGFGDGTDSIRVTRSGNFAPGLYVSISGNASLIRRIEYDTDIKPGTDNYGYYDSNNEWVYLGDTDSITYTRAESGCYHVIWTYHDYPSSISSIWVGVDRVATQNGVRTVTFSNFRIYDSNGNILNMDIATPSYSAKIGTSAISKCYLGNTEIVKVYMGRNVLYEKSDSSSSGNASFGGTEFGGWDG